MKTRDDVTAWPVAYNQWEQDFVGFLDEQSHYTDGSVEDTHQRLVKARHMIQRTGEQQLSAFLDGELTQARPTPATNNLIESMERAAA